MPDYSKYLKATSNAELLSYIINTSPTLGEIELPVQGESIKPIGELIMDNQRYRNAFINAINLIGLTVVKRNAWENPWNFTQRGTLRRGQSVREMIIDLVDANDYNEAVKNPTKLLSTVVPNVLSYIHSVNFQKYYKTTTSDQQMAMAFEDEGNLLDFISQAIEANYQSYVYDYYIIDKYMLCRRILDGTVTPAYLENFAQLDARDKVSAMKSVSNKMSFRSPNYNPAGLRKATAFADQILIVSTEFEADFSTKVLATSFFKDEADMRARMVLVDGFGNHDTERLAAVLEGQYVPFTAEELAELATIPAVLISREWFMDYAYALDGQGDTRNTEFFNAETLRNNHYLHSWRVHSTSPYENAAVFTPAQPAVTSVALLPDDISIPAGVATSIKFTATTKTTGFANEAVYFTAESIGGSTFRGSISQDGTVTVGADNQAGDKVTITATSVFDPTKTATATLSFT